MEKLQYENLNLQVNEKRPQLRRMNSLSFLTKETDFLKNHTESDAEPPTLAFKRKTVRNSSLIVNAVIKKEMYE